METLSWEPRAFMYHNFLTQEECEHMINLAKPTMVKSSVIDNDTGKSVDSRCGCLPCCTLPRMPAVDDNWN